MNQNFVITLEYDGSRFSGWQVQPGKITVQGELEKTLALILNQPVRLNGSGRTDAGVHALGQVANFHADTNRSCTDLKRGLNSMIKAPIVVHHCALAGPEFHARFSAVSKEYHYHILNRQEPCALGRDYVWHINRPLDLGAMEACCSMLIGEHDFKSFEGAGSPRYHTVREVFRAGFNKMEPDRLIFQIRANGFLRFMVRNILGTLILAGRCELSPEDFKAVLQARDRSLAGATAPPHGLFLMKVSYPESSFS
ncbi:MAG: tRNA pseudouridine(38-40) synthase TruA [Pseudomonadota bacterium]